MLLSMGGSSLNKELLEYFNYDIKVATSSAFVQQRDKLLPEALGFLLHQFTHSLKNHITYEGYRLFAVDGSNLNIPHNSSDLKTYIKTSPNAKGYNLLHLNAMYDLCNKLYLDVSIQPLRQLNESKALRNMVDRSTVGGKVIIIAANQKSQVLIIKIKSS